MKRLVMSIYVAREIGFVERESCGRTENVARGVILVVHTSHSACLGILSILPTESPQIRCLLSVYVLLSLALAGQLGLQVASVSCSL